MQEIEDNPARTDVRKAWTSEEDQVLQSEAELQCG